MTYSDRQLREFIFTFCYKNNLSSKDQSVLLIIVKEPDFARVNIKLSVSPGEITASIHKISNVLECANTTDAVGKAIKDLCAAAHPSSRRYPLEFINAIIAEHSLDLTNEGEMLKRYNDHDCAKEQLYYRRTTHGQWILQKSLSNIAENVMDALGAHDVFGLKQRLELLYKEWLNRDIQKRRVECETLKHYHCARISDQYEAYLRPLRKALQQSMKASLSS